MRPPVPVSAPGNGATPDGKLWVSAVKMMSWSTSASTIGDGLAGRDGQQRPVVGEPRIELELSLKAMTLLLGLALSGPWIMAIRCVRDLLAVEHQPALEEPVARVLAVRLGDVEALDVGRVAADPFAKESGVVVEVPVVERQTHLRVDPLEGGATLLEDRDLGHGAGLDPDRKTGQRLGVGALGHAVVDRCEKTLTLVIGHRRCRQEEAPRPLDPPDRVEAAGVTDRHRVGRPGGGEAHPRPDLEDLAAVGCEEALGGETVGLEGLGEKPAQHLLLAVVELVVAAT